MSNKKTKIIYILPMLYIGGAEKILFDVIKKIDKERFEVGLALLKKNEIFFSGWEEELAAENVKVENFLIQDNLFLKIFDIPRKFISLVSYLRQEKPDIVHTHLLYADIIGRFAAWLAGVKRIITTEHNQIGYGDKIKNCLTKFIDQKTFAFVAVSEEVAAYLKSERKIAENKIIIIHNGIETEKYVFPDRQYDKEKLVIGAMGKIARQKGFDLLIESLKMINADYECLIAGDEDLHERDLRLELEELIVRNNLADKVKFVGLQEARHFFQGIDIFVSSSRWDGLSLVLLEAGAAGLPIVAFNVGGVGSVIHHEEDGLIVEKEDVGKMSESITRLLVDENLRTKFGQKTAEKIRNNFDISRVVKSHEELYISL